ncbi:MAG: FAD-dependent oxidoreductase [Pseudomonadota bacterium]
MNSSPKVAVVGAGAAGLASADVLVAAGIRPIVFERSRSFGGRVASRRRGDFQFDHGAQFLSPGADALLRRARVPIHPVPWESAGLPDGSVPLVGTPRMKDVFAPFVEGLDIRYGSEVTQISRTPDGRWRIDTEAATETVDGVILAAPAPQCLRILDTAEVALHAKLESIPFAPCHALMVAFERLPDWPDVQHAPPRPFSLLLNDRSKPGRTSPLPCFVGHTTAEWSERNLETAPDDVASALLDALDAALGTIPPVVAAIGHRWRFSRPVRPLGVAFAESADGTLLAGGDWALGQFVEHALASGRAMAEATIHRFRS